TPSPEDNVGLRVRDRRSDERIVYAAAAADAAAVVAPSRGARALLFDGTFWSSDELATRADGGARAEDMAHQPLSGEKGSLRALAALDVARRVLTHVNNTNPILRDG